MKVYETVIPENKPYQRVKSRKCDLCGVESKGEEWPGKGIYDTNETVVAVEIRQKEGVTYPALGPAAEGTKYEIDICPVCFKEKLIPWLISQGANIKQENWDY